MWNRLDGLTKAARNLRLDNESGLAAAACLERIQGSISKPAFGFKVQAIAAHVLIRLGFRIVAINSSGHPDITAEGSDGLVHLEVEAEAGPSRLRMLTAEDFKSLTDNIETAKGYYALAVGVPSPRWILVDATKLQWRRNPTPRAVFEALSDRRLSHAWTDAYVKLLVSSCELIELGSYSSLRLRALAGHGL